jgi:hypothetical protein
MKKVNLFAIAAISFSISTFVACTSVEISAPDASYFESVVNESPSYSDQTITIAEEFVTAYEASVQQVSGLQKSVAMVNPYPIITVLTEKNVYPQIILIDFGDNFTDRLGRIIKGQIYLTKYSSTKKTYEFSNLFVNDISVKGYRTITVVVKGTLNIESKDTLLFPDKKTSNRHLNRTRTWIDNNGTEYDWSDDKFSLTGSTSGVNTKGETYSTIIDNEQPLITKNGYKYFVSGVISIITPKGTQVVDFGDGTEDNIATSTINGLTKQITYNW